MYFGEFLLSRKIINEDQLLAALIFQVEQLPSFLRVLHEEKILSSYEIIRMIQLQFETNHDLVTVLRNENKIDEVGLQKLYHKQVAKRKMLGSVLVELKFAEQSVIEKMLHEFLRDNGNLQKIQSQEKVKLVEKPLAVEISEAALESLRELGLSDEAFVAPSPAAVSPMPIAALSVENNIQMDNVFIDEFLNTFNEKMNGKFDKLIKFLNQSTKDESDISNYFNSLYRDLFILKGSALLAELSFSVSILDEWAGIIESKLTLSNDQLRKWGVIALPILEESMAFLWEIRGVVLLEKNEESIHNVSSLNDRYLKVIALIKTIK